MTVRDLLTAELTLEAAFTRMHLERVPMDRLDYKAHDRSMTLGWLATFLAIMPTWGGYTLMRDSFDVAPPGGQAPRPEIARSSADLLKMFDANVADVRATLATIGEDRLAEPWTLLAAGRQIFSQPRALVFQTLLHPSHGASPRPAGSVSPADRRRRTGRVQRVCGRGGRHVHRALVDHIG